MKKIIVEIVKEAIDESIDVVIEAVLTHPRVVQAIDDIRHGVEAQLDPK